MNQNHLEIDLSRSNKENDGEDSMKIQLKSGNTVNFNFSKFFFRSKYLFDKYSEMMKSIEREIVEIESKFSIKEEIIKEFIEIITKDKVFIPIEHYKDIYTLSKHFCIPQLTNLLDNIMENLNDNDLNFCIQILLDETETEKTKAKDKEETGILSKIENLIKSRVNECLKNDKFKEVPIPMIYRIIESVMSIDRERVDVNILLDFILESAENRFILFRFVELHRLKKENLDKLIKFIDKQEEKLQGIYLEYIPFNFLFIKKMKREYEEFSKLFHQNQTELKQMKQDNEELSNNFNKSQIEIKQIQKELEQTKEKLNQSLEESKRTQEELKQIKDKFNQVRSDIKQYANTIMVGGYDTYNQLGDKPNKNYIDTPYIHPPQKSSIDPSSLLSFSTYRDHSVEVTRSGKLLGIGNNSNGRISDSLPKKTITEFTEFSIRDSSGRQLDPVSAVCSEFGTLYMFSSGSRRQLVLCDKEINGGHPVFLDIGDEYPVSLFGGFSHSAAISNKGEVIFINRNAVKKSPESKIKTVCLPDGEKAVSVACCRDSVVALSSNGRVFLSAVQSESNLLNFSAVSELSGQEIVWVSGTFDHFLVVSRKGRVFGRGENVYGKLGLGQQTSSISSFTEISSLNSHKIRAAYAGSWHSLFETCEGKILACGYNCFSPLLLSNDEHEYAYSPIETMITKSATFCIAGDDLSAVFIGGEPPPNTPNRLIEKFE